tara:strand:- start:488 stop:604 length:117 start_codon:yes stop_codon:yes gene_type:complete
MRKHPPQLSKKNRKKQKYLWANYVVESAHDPKTPLIEG